MGVPERCLTSVLCAVTPSPKTPGVAFHRFPQNPDKRSKWIRCLKLKKDSIKESHRICSRHFPNGDVNSDPSLVIGKKFASPIKPWSARLKRVKARDLWVLMRNASTSISPSPVTSKSPSPMPVNNLESPSPVPVDTSKSPGPTSVITSPTPVNETSESSDSAVAADPQSPTLTARSLPSESDSASVSDLQVAVTATVRSSDDQGGSSSSDTSSSAFVGCPRRNTEVMVSTALLARIELLEAENKRLKDQLNCSQKAKREPLSIASNQDLFKLLHWICTLFSIL